MERRISGVSYMCWIDFHNGIWGCGFLCARLITLYFLSLFCVSLSGYHAEGYHVPSLPPRAITPVYTSRLPHQSYHAPPHTYIGLSHLLLVIRILYFIFRRLLRHFFFSSYTTTGRHTLHPTPHHAYCMALKEFFLLRMS